MSEPTEAQRREYEERTGFPWDVPRPKAQEPDTDPDYTGPSYYQPADNR